MRVFPVALTLAILLAGCADQAPDPPATTAPADPAPAPEPSPAARAAPPKDEEPTVPNPSQRTLQVVLATGQPLSIVAPAGWDLASGRDGAEFFLLSPLEGPGDTFRENVNLLIVEVGEMTLDEYDMITLQGIETMIEDSEIVGMTAATFAGREGKRIDYTGRIGELEGSWIGWYFIEEGFAHVFTYTAQAGYEEPELAEAIAASVTIGEPSVFTRAA